MSSFSLINMQRRRDTSTCCLNSFVNKEWHQWGRVGTKGTLGIMEEESGFGQTQLKMMLVSFLLYIVAHNLEGSKLNHCWFFGERECKQKIRFKRKSNNRKVSCKVKICVWENWCCSICIVHQSITHWEWSPLCLWKIIYADCIFNSSALQLQNPL